MRYHQNRYIARVILTVAGTHAHTTTPTVVVVEILSMVQAIETPKKKKIMRLKLSSFVWLEKVRARYN